MVWGFLRELFATAFPRPELTQVPLGFKENDMGSLNTLVTLTEELSCYPSNEPADIALTMKIGDAINFVDDGDCALFYSPPGFTQVEFDGGWAFVATTQNTTYPYAYFMFAGSGGRFVTYSVVVYPS